MWIFEHSTFYFVFFYLLLKTNLYGNQKKRWTLNLTFAERWWGRTGDGGGTVGVKQQSLSTLSSPACSSSLQLLVSPSSLQKTTILQANTNFTKQITSMYKLTVYRWRLLLPLRGATCLRRLSLPILNSYSHKLASGQYSS